MLESAAVFKYQKASDSKRIGLAYKLGIYFLSISGRLTSPLRQLQRPGPFAGHINRLISHTAEAASSIANWLSGIQNNGGVCQFAGAISAVES